MRPKRALRFLQAAGILLLMVGVLAWVGLNLFGLTGMLVALGFGILLLVMAFRRRVQVQNTVRLRPDNAPEAHRMLEELSQQAGLTHTPELHLLSAPSMEAATIDSGGEPIMVITQPLLESLPSRELRAILAHEVSHVRQHDPLYFKLAGVVRMLTTSLATAGWFVLIIYLPLLIASGQAGPLGLVFLVLVGAPFVSVLLQLALSRSRELAADSGAVELTGDPEALASALRRLDAARESLFRQLLPFPRRRQQPSPVLRTHPSIDKRIERLESMAQ